MQKGQVFSLDLLIAITLIILAFALLIQQFEVFQYNLKQDQLQAELQRIGLTASNLLVSNPSIACELVDSSNPPKILDYLPNCIPRSNGIPKITASVLGLPQGFDYCLERVAGNANYFLQPQQYDSCNNEGPGSSVKNVFSIQRKIVVFNGQGSSIQVDKASFDNCTKGIRGEPNCELKTQLIELRVWKE